ncbi:signal peptidase II [Microbacterium sediminis]|uniref:signal peptidase II n=1 Tax=Microbacterium sediminis TaxID=904291 RepID=UPI000A0393BF|nr:signal peptidase II [Microbacterium sediminis]QBR74500.1 signal peptidase II [Microbacterium sediminis]
MRHRAPLRTAAAGTLIAILAVLVLAADQFSKQLVLQHLEPGVAVPVAGEALQFVLVFNPGAAFSLGEGVTWIFTIAMAIVAGVIVFLAATRVRSRLWAVVLGLLLGGVLGNLADRLFREPGFAVGHVVDFILTPWMWFWTPNAAIYNVADIFIVGGMAAVALLLVIGIELDGTRGATRDAPVAAESVADADAGATADADAGPADTDPAVADPAAPAAPAKDAD